MSRFMLKLGAIVLVWHIIYYLWFLVTSYVAEFKQGGL